MIFTRRSQIQTLGVMAWSVDLGIGGGQLLLCITRPIGLPMNQKNTVFYKNVLKMSDALSLVPCCFEDSMVYFICFLANWKSNTS